ncbi:hypothetical protein Taro_034047 [Colocasia esculenta]|uniref:CCHC-type domain-containing protein n=1 Tax=Colocasia esculenta TaxID=4460 RepID=A0A843VVF8_COLES|nr:hypothetical protein [Colocasia esculenta]
MKAKHFLNGLKPHYITQLEPFDILTYAKMLLEDATDFTDHIKGKFVKKKVTSGESSAKPTNGKKRPFNITKGSSQERKPKVFVPNTPTKSHCKHCDKPGHTADECWRKAEACLRCGSREHRIPECPMLKENEKCTAMPKKQGRLQALHNEETIEEGRPICHPKQNHFCAIHPNESDVSMCSYVKGIWDNLKLIYEGTSEVKETKANILVSEYELFRIKPEETISEMFARFTTITNGLKALGKEYTNSELVRKILRSLPPTWHTKATVIEDSKNMATLSLEEQIGSLMTYELNMKRNEPEIKKGKGISLKAAFVRQEKNSTDEGSCDGPRRSGLLTQ